MRIILYFEKQFPKFDVKELKLVWFQVKVKNLVIEFKVDFCQSLLENFVVFCLYYFWLFLLKLWLDQTILLKISRIQSKMGQRCSFNDGTWSHFHFLLSSITFFLILFIHWHIQIFSFLISIPLDTRFAFWYALCAFEIQSLCLIHASSFGILKWALTKSKLGVIVERLLGLIVVLHVLYLIHIFTI